MLRRSIVLAVASVMVATTSAPIARAGDGAAGSETRSRGSGQRVLGLLIANVGLVSFASGVVLGRDRANQPGSQCMSDVCASMASLFVEDLQSRSGPAFGLMALGALAMAGGVAFHLAAPTTKKRTPGIAGAGIAIGSGGITFTTSF